MKCLRVLKLQAEIVLLMFIYKLIIAVYSQQKEDIVAAIGRFCPHL